MPHNRHRQYAAKVGKRAIPVVAAPVPRTRRSSALPSEARRRLARPERQRPPRRPRPPRGDRRPAEPLQGTRPAGERLRSEELADRPLAPHAPDSAVSDPERPRDRHGHGRGVHQPDRRQARAGRAHRPRSGREDPRLAIRTCFWTPGPRATASPSTASSGATWPARTPEAQLHSMAADSSTKKRRDVCRHRPRRGLAPQPLRGVSDRDDLPRRPPPKTAAPRTARLSRYRDRRKYLARRSQRRRSLPGGERTSTESGAFIPVQAYLDLKGHPERAKEAAEQLRKDLLTIEDR